MSKEQTTISNIEKTTGDASVLSVDVGDNDELILENLDISTCKVTGTTTKIGNGGAMKITMSGSGSVSMRSVTFTSCGSEGNGGAVNIKYNNADAKLEFYATTFSGCTVPTEKALTVSDSGCGGAIFFEISVTPNEEIDWSGITYTSTSA